MKRMTAAEIEREFAGEWVLLSDPEYAEDDEVVSGVVIVHSENQEDLWKSPLPRPFNVAALFAGAPEDDGIAYIL